MATLLDLGHLQKPDGWRTLRQLIHMTLAEIISWKKGTFHFEVDHVEINDDFRHIPTAVTEGGVDIKGALLEALRIFDERNRTQRDQENNPDRHEAAPGNEAIRNRLATPSEIPIREEPEDTIYTRPEHSHEAIFLSTNNFIKHSMTSICKKAHMFSFVAGVEKEIVKEIDRCYADATAPALVVDLSGGEDSVLGSKRRIAMIGRITAQFPELPIIIISDKVSSPAYILAFNLGARTLIPVPKQDESNQAAYTKHMGQFVTVLVSSLQGVFREDYRLLKTARDARMQISSLKLRIHQIQDRKTSPDVSLVVLQYMAEYLERGIIFLVRKNDLLGLGSFGVDTKGETISNTVVRLKIPLSEPSVFRQVVQTGMVFKGAADDAVLDEYVFDRIGPPTSNEVLILPLKTENRTRAIVYGDFGRNEALSMRTDAFEILASQAGMAIELALQRARQR